MHPLPLRDSVKAGVQMLLNFFPPMQCIQITSLTASISFFQQLPKHLWLWPLFWCFTAPFLDIQTELYPDRLVCSTIISSQKGVCRMLWPNQNGHSVSLTYTDWKSHLSHCSVFWSVQWQWFCNKRPTVLICFVDWLRPGDRFPQKRIFFFTFKE